MFNIFNKIFERKEVFKFLCTVRDFSIFTPVVLAKNVRPICATLQKNRPAEKRYQACPGITDYANSGYIIPAHTDISIKANKVGTAVNLNWQLSLTQQELMILNVHKFDYDIVDGLVNVNEIKKEAVKIPLPWMIEAPAGYSGYLMPAFMHSDFLDKIHVYPGIVDYDKFYVVNFIFTALKECEFTIRAGEPLLQVIFFKREEFSAECRKATQYEMDKYVHNRATSVKNWYRRFLYGKKVHKLECPYNNKDKK